MNKLFKILLTVATSLTMVLSTALPSHAVNTDEAINTITFLQTFDTGGFELVSGRLERLMQHELRNADGVLLRTVNLNGLDMTNVAIQNADLTYDLTHVQERFLDQGNLTFAPRTHPAAYVHMPYQSWRMQQRDWNHLNDDNYFITVWHDELFENVRVLRTPESIRMFVEGEAADIYEAAEGDLIIDIDEVVELIEDPYRDFDPDAIVIPPRGNIQEPVTEEIIIEENENAEEYEEATVVSESIVETANDVESPEETTFNFVILAVAGIVILVSILAVVVLIIRKRNTVVMSEDEDIDFEDEED